MTNFFYIAFLLFTLTAASVATYNFITNPVLRRRSPLGQPAKQFVSVLIPARNESENIERILNSVIQQTHRELEIIVLDDNSEDDTYKIASSLATRDSRLRTISGSVLPKGWTGKNWACYQLATAANGDLFLFIDADVQLAPEAVSSAVTLMHERNLAMLSIFPTQIMNSLGERLVVPLMNWLLLSFLPLRFVADSTNPKFVAANGQFICIRRDVYEEVGGHQAVKDKIVEDMELARRLKRSNHKIMTLLGGELLSCRMYRNVTDAMNGFTKNFYPGFAMPKLFFVSMVLMLGFAFVGPWVAAMKETVYLIPVGIVIFNRFLISLVSRQSVLYNVVLHPLQMIFLVIIGLKSVKAASKGEITWKGRRV